MRTISSELTPEPIIVYWVSKYNGSKDQKGWDTPMYKANFMSFTEMEQAAESHAKLVKLMNTGGKYRGHIVHKVAPLSTEATAELIDTMAAKARWAQNAFSKMLILEMEQPSYRNAMRQLNDLVEFITGLETKNV